MAIDFLHRLTMFMALLVAQVLILNHVHLLGVATPMLYIYFAITFRRNFPRWITLLSSFFLGLMVDIFSSTPGLAAGSMTFIAFLQPFLLERMAPRDSAEDMKVSIATMGLSRFSFMSAVLTLIYCLLFFSLEFFSFFDWLLWFGCFLGSAALTWILMMAIESVRSR